MSRSLALAFALILICSLPAIAMPGTDGPDRVSDRQAALGEGSPEWLTPSDGPAASGDGYVATDVGATLDDDSSRLESRYDDHRLDTRLENADSDAERREIVREEADRLSETIDRLRERERTAYEEYYGGERSERELLVELAAIHTNAVALDDSVASLGSHAGDVPELSIDDRLEAMDVETLTMQGPVRERVAGTLHGETGPTHVHVETDGDGVALGLIEDNEFHREAHRIDNRDPNAGSRYTSLGQSEARIAELYPTIFTDARWSYSEVGYGTHRGVGNHAQGTLTVYLDTGTGEVYREHQTLDLDRIDTAPVERQTLDGVEATLSGTVPGGPAKLTLTDAETDEPLSGSVAFNNRTVGTTNDAGEVWFVAPRDSATITAVVDSTRIGVPISEESATARPPNDDEGS